MAYSEHGDVKSTASAGIVQRRVGAQGGLKPTPQDEVDLARFGKRQQLNRRFRFVSIVALTCTLMITWEGYLTNFEISLENGGPAGSVYSYIFVWIGTIFQTLVMAELASMIPLAGGQYNWVSILAPPSYSKFLSYTTGWMTFLAWQATLTASAFLGATMIQGLLVLNYPSYDFQRWHGTLLLYAIIALASLTNTYLARVLPQIESLILVIHILGYLGIMVPLVHFAPHASAPEVFQNFLNGGGWPTNGLSFFVGLSGGQGAFIGIDAAAHMAEEIQGASVVIPWSMISSVLLNGVTGFGMVIALLFCLGDISDALQTPTGYPYIQIFANAVGSTDGATAMASIITIMLICASFGSLATASRMTWAFAREKGLPFHRFLSRVDRGTSLPLYCIAVNILLSLLLALINIGSTTVFNALVSLVVAGNYSCFALSSGTMLYHRLTVPNDKIRWGPFALGAWGVPVNVLALIYTLIGIIFSFWPQTPGPTAETMNWSSPVFCGVAIFSVVYWLVWGRFVYTGPIKEVVLEGGEIVT